MVSYLDQTGLKYTLDKLRNQMYPVGSLYFSTNSTSPATIYGGTWERYSKGRTLVSVNESDVDFTAGKTGGEKEHTLIIDEMPSHRHESLNSLRCKAAEAGSMIRLVVHRQMTLVQVMDGPSIPETARRTTTCHHTLQSIFGEGRLRTQYSP